MTDLERAKTLLLSANASYTCVLCKGDTVYTSEKRGIAPMMDLLDSGAELTGFCAADRIVGKAAAMLFSLAKVNEVWADVMTDGAIDFFKKSGIACTWRVRTPRIVNRNGDGPCPMEKAVEKVSDPTAARVEIRKAMKLLSQK